jgi:hypothetical protein
MSVRTRSNCQIRKTNAKRAIEAAEMAGKKVAQFKIDQTGTMTLVFDNGAADTAKSDPLDTWMAARADANQGH